MGTRRRPGSRVCEGIIAVGVPAHRHNTVRQQHAVSKNAAKRIYQGATVPVLTYGSVAWGNLTQLHHPSKMLNRAVRPYLLAIARIPPATKGTLIPRLTQMPSLAATMRYHTAHMLLQNPELFRRFVLPWLNRTSQAWNTDKQPMRKYIAAVLEPHEAIIAAAHQHGDLPLMKEGRGPAQSHDLRIGKHMLKQSSPTLRQLRHYCLFLIVVLPATPQGRAAAGMLLPHPRGKLAEVEHSATAPPQHDGGTFAIQLASLLAHKGRVTRQRSETQEAAQPTTHRPPTKFLGYRIIAFLVEEDLGSCTAPNLHRALTRLRLLLPNIRAHLCTDFRSGPLFRYLQKQAGRRQATMGQGHYTIFRHVEAMDRERHTHHERIHSSIQRTLQNNLRPTGQENSSTTPAPSDAPTLQGLCRRAHNDVGAWTTNCWLASARQPPRQNGTGKKSNLSSLQNSRGDNRTLSAFLPRFHHAEAAHVQTMERSRERESGLAHHADQHRGMATHQEGHRRRRQIRLQHQTLLRERVAALQRSPPAARSPRQYGQK